MAKFKKGDRVFVSKYDAEEDLKNVPEADTKKLQLLYQYRVLGTVNCVYDHETFKNNVIFDDNANMPSYEGGWNFDDDELDFVTKKATYGEV